MEKLFITPGIFQMLCNNYNPRAKEPIGGILLAGKCENKLYCDTGHGSGFLFDFLMDEKYLNRIHYASENSDSFSLIPWFQYDKKEFDENFHEFIENEIKDNFQSFLVLKPTRVETKRNFVFEYYYESIDDKIIPGKIEIVKTTDVDKNAKESIARFMDYCIKKQQKSI